MKQRPPVRRDVGAAGKALRLTAHRVGCARGSRERRGDIIAHFGRSGPFEVRADGAGGEQREDGGRKEGLNARFTLCVAQGCWFGQLGISTRDSINWLSNVRRFLLTQRRDPRLAGKYTMFEREPR